MPPTFYPTIKLPRLSIRLRPAAEAEVRRGHPWIFDQSIRDQNREGTPGELAVVYSRNDEFLAVGFYDPSSPIRVRVLHTGKPVTIDSGWFEARFSEALARRKDVLDHETNAARLINGESDRFPALVLDRYAETLVLKIYSAIWIPRLRQLVRTIQEHAPSERLVLRLSRNITDDAARLQIANGQILFGSPLAGPVEFRESGLVFEADVLKGQKTGFFLDQRENRRLVGAMAAGRDVLNAFSFSGGFSLYAARGGARSVTDVDISAHALESSRRNFRLNGFAEFPHQRIQADVFAWLRDPGPPRYDLIVLDPPSLAKREADRPAALSAYAALASAGATFARPNAILVCCSCSGHVRREEFTKTVLHALNGTGRTFEVLRETCEPPDHHATFPEAQYLKAIYLALD